MSTEQLDRKSHFLQVNTEIPCDLYFQQWDLLIEYKILASLEP